MRIRKRLTMYLTGLCVFLSACMSGLDLSPEYGVATLTVNGHEIYVKRTVSGQNYDSLILSTNKDHCTDYDPASDFRFNGLGPQDVYYKIEGNTLYLYLTIEAVKPKDFPSPIEVKQSVLDPLSWKELKDNYQRMGLKHLEVNINKELKCR